MVRTNILAILIALLLGGRSASAHDGAAQVRNDAAATRADEFKMDNDTDITGEEWVPIITTPTKSQYFIRLKDAERITTTGRFWTKIDHSKDVTSKHRKTMVLQEIDCKSETIRGLSLVRYDAAGKVTESSNLQQFVPVNIAPETTGASIQDFVCKPSRQN